MQHLYVVNDYFKIFRQHIIKSDSNEPLIICYYYFCKNCSKNTFNLSKSLTIVE